MKTTDLQLIHGDSLDVMRSMADNSIDMILTDPPYYSTALKFDQAPRIDFKAWLQECRRILKPAGVLVSFADFNLMAELREHKVFKTQYELVWHKSIATGFLDANIRPLRAHEFIVIFTQALITSLISP
jgi:site-specific DNA-methyltransferase (adenine-specific)